MAENLASHVRAHPEALTMALTGEVHGRATPTGTAWYCVGASPGDCGPKETKANAAFQEGQTVGIELLPEPTKRGNDGLFATSSLTASPPARLAR